MLFELVIGVRWEVMEFGSGLVMSVLAGKPVQAQFGLGDNALDLAANPVGGMQVTVAGIDRFRRLTRNLRDHTTVLGEREDG